MVRKMNFFLSALLVLLFGMALNTFSYASSIDTEEMTYEDADYLFNYSMTTSITTSRDLPTCYNFSPKCVETSYSEAGTQTTSKAQVNSAFNNDTAKNNFLTAFNNANITYNSNLSIKNYMFIFYTSDNFISSWNGSSYLYVLCIPVNNTSSDILPFPVVYYNRFPESSYGIGQMTLDFLTNNDDLTMRILTTSERDNLSMKPFLITIDRDFSCTYSINNWYSRKFRIITNKSYRAILYDYSSSDTLKYSPLNIIFPIDQARNTLYAPTNLSSTSSISSFNSSTFSPFLIKSWGRIIQNEEPEPEEPENPDNPDIPGSGTTGNITNPSGDTTGKVDLSGIEQGIGDINENLNGISGEIGKLNENLTTVPDISGTTINSGDITGALNFDFIEDPYSNFWLELTTRTFWCFN